MKPRPQFSVHDFLARGNGLPDAILPYDTYATQHASYLAFALGEEFVGLPMAQLASASLRAGATAIALDFGSLVVRIEGRGLELLFECILRGQVRVVRTGRHPACTVEVIRLSETAPI